MNIHTHYTQGEIRFAATAAKRLGQLGALTQGDRLACLGSSDLQVRWGCGAGFDVAIAMDWWLMTRSFCTA
jgi:hypothetical protein